MKGKCSTHLVNVSEISTSSTSDPDYYSEQGLPIYAHMVNVQETINTSILFSFQSVLT